MREVLSADAYDNAIRERLNVVANKLSQSEVARRTKTPRGKINRYLAGTRISADFLCAIADGCEINPAWLLSGEGAPTLEAVSPATGEFAGTMLELVSAMNDVSKMKLGNLVKTENLQDLYQLNQQIATFRKLREDIARQTRPIFDALLKNCQDALRAREMERAESLERAMSQVFELCQDDALQHEILKMRYVLMNWRGRSGEVMSISRQLFSMTLANPQRALANMAQDANNYALSLRKGGFIDESCRIARAALELLEPGNDHYALLRASLALSEAYRGNLDEAIAISKGASATFKIERLGQFARAAYLHLLLWNGTLSFRQAALISKGDDNWSIPLLQFALWSEEKDDLKTAVKRGAKSLIVSGAPRFRVLLAWARQLREAQAGKTSALADFVELTKADRAQLIPVELFEWWTGYAQTALALNDTENTAKGIQEARNIWQCLDKGCFPAAPSIACFHRSVLRLRDAKVSFPENTGAADDAEAFFRSCINRGYKVFDTAFESKQK
ncbi:MAG: helix-turn-helix transcriptional regulator [Planctomycetaceae bacterium]|nr:helix-turn-helix transcriptional regulator [Planctomycetaceae bacterium]